VEALVQRGDTLLAMGRPEEAIAALQRGVQLKPERASSHSSLARAYWLGKGQVDEAIVEFEHMLRLNPEAGYTHLQLAMLYTLKGDYDRAERVARRAIRLQDQVMSGTTGLIIIGAHARLGYVLYRRARYDEAILEYRRELELLSVSDHLLRERTSIELNQKLAAAYRRKGDVAAALAHEQQAIERFAARLSAGADEPFTRYYLAALHALRGEAETAREHLELPLQRVEAFTRWRLPRDPDFAPVQGHPRFEGLL
jgi:tetratricopeptide (TPR) repeat protein